MSSSNVFFFFLKEVIFFHWRLEDVESASKYVAGKHRILTIMNISGHYENMPIQIYRKFRLQKLKIFR